MKQTDNPFKQLVELNYRMAQSAALQPSAAVGTVGHATTKYSD